MKTRMTSLSGFLLQSFFRFGKFLLLLISVAPAIELHAQVQVYKGTETIPTHRRGPDETSPIFYTGRGVQGAAGHYYPYPAQINLEDTVVDMTYDMVYLENEYLKVTIIPAFGGKLYAAVDKTTGLELFHRNNTIKPDLIATLGAWISGGIEWCYPHHHRTSTFIPADYRILRNSDGSATVWVGETDRSLRLRGVIGITLHPGRSTIEADYRLNNPNPVTRNFKFWANVAVTAGEHFRTFWPPSQEIAVFHNNSSFVHWPIANEIYRGIDYTGGIDLTWWKNHPSPVSFFFWKGEEGFIGGYDYALKSGIVHVGDTYKSRISKLWQFGPGAEGRNAESQLSDEGKAYVELMTGTFSNNQPDYSWFAPHMAKDAKHYWYPLRDIEIAKNATKDAAITLQMRNDRTVFFGVNTTGVMKKARIVLSYKGEEVFSKQVDIDPATPFTSVWTNRDEVDEYQLRLTFVDENGAELIAYTPYKRQLPELPEEFKDFSPAREIDSPEELYLTGRAVEQYSRPFHNADDYYLRALEISPDDYRVNMALGIRRVNQWRFEEAESYLKRAAFKLKTDYIQPKEGELYYYMALAQRAQGKTAEAVRNFNYAAYDYAWFSAANYQLAQMECERGNTAQALKHIDDAHSTNNRDGGIAVLFSALLRKAGRGNEALPLIDKALDFDPLNYALLYERQLITGQSPIGEMQDNMQDVENNTIEIATNYLNAGLFGEAARLFEGVNNPLNPLFLYYKAYSLAKNGQGVLAEEALKSAKTKPFDYIFPYRAESERVLKFAVEADPGSPFAWYLMGNLLYEKRPAEAISAWEAAGKAGNQMPMVKRNLAFGAYHFQKDALKAVELITEALAESPDHPLWYAELESYWEASDRDTKECIAIMESQLDMVKRNISAPQALVKLYNLHGEYDKAIDLLDRHHFRTWEGGRSIYWHHVDANALKALQLIKEGKTNEATARLNRAMEYPENLDVGKPINDERNAMIWYFLARICDRTGKKKAGLKNYNLCITAKNSRDWADLMFYQGLACQKTGDLIKAGELFESLASRGKELTESSVKVSGIGINEGASVAQRKSVSEGYYLQGLALLGMGKKAEAQECFIRALSIFRNHLWAKYFLDNDVLFF